MGREGSSPSSATMPICKECGGKFPYKVRINGKECSLRARSYCLKCSPYGEYKGYELRKNKNNFKNKDGERIRICTKRQREFKWTKNNVCSTCRSAVVRWSRKNKAVNFLGGECVNCGNSDIDVLTFHHLNSDEKDINLS